MRRKKGLNYKKIRQRIRIDPLWPQWFFKHYTDLRKKPHVFKESKLELYSFFETHLRKCQLQQGRGIRSWDEERKSVDTIVVHHTGNHSGIALTKLEAIGLLNVYLPVHAERRPGEPISSGHFRETLGREIFHTYHHLVRPNGAIEDLLEAKEIGWHAGDWDINCRSIAICFDGNFEHTTPCKRALAAAAALIRERYANVPIQRIFGHCEVSAREQICPSRLFVGAWKRDLLAQVQNLSGPY